MDDMDRQSEELGGKSSFFKGEFKKYRWADLLDKRFGGHERLLLYAEGLERMNENKNIPQLFRDIFKGVFLPYRDPETLNLFLKEINGFNYDHSERLGDAYEYLLSVLGTQGEAGQFRTPRHIIDFIVAVVDPQKHETVLDPACGTAGFLISAYKHILATAITPPSALRTPHSDLTPDERARLMTNFCGYDIAPDMVRLSRVNLYLHGFPQPVIHEYDTLTSEERWDERYDVIMANPPFMTPKGGIRPHNRFSIQASRSEVLFVDYIAEHLNPGGRAGVIVPEGIIFQSQNAYKHLRRMLVENYLWAVVSLPAGVFNPYSGVKTSILFLDRNLAKRTDAVLFVKIENDGFDLGAQRRAIEQNDLPEALKALQQWKVGVDRRAVRKFETDASARRSYHAVPRKRLLESLHCNLSGDCYRPTAARSKGKWPTVKLGEMCEMEYGLTRSASASGDTRFIRITDIARDGILSDADAKFIQLDDEALPYVLRKRDVLVARTGATFGKTAVFEAEFQAVFASYLIRLRFPSGCLLPKFYWFFSLSEKYWEQARRLASGGGQPQFNGNALKKIEIPLPPLAEQERLVAELEGYRKVIEAARHVVANYKATLRLDPKWPTVKLGTVCSQERRIASSKAERALPYLGLENVESETGRLLLESSNSQEAISTSFVFNQQHVLYGKLRPYLNKVALPDFPGRCTTELIPLLPSNKLERRSLFWLLLRPETVQIAMNGKTGARMPRADMELLLSMGIPLPPLDTQREIVAELEAERVLVEANRELMARFERKLQAKLAELWGEAEQTEREP